MAGVGELVYLAVCVYMCGTCVCAGILAYVRILGIQKSAFGV